eukprot:XP_001693644.1 predicted protein [Chlamydomonas reinhardtii]
MASAAVDSGRQRSLLANAQALVAELRALPLDPATTRASYPRMFDLVRLVKRYSEATAALPADETRAMWEQRGQWLQEEVAGLAQERIYSPDQQQYWLNLLLLLFAGAEACDRALREKLELDLALQAAHRQAAELGEQLRAARSEAEQAAQRTAVPPGLAEELLEARSKAALLVAERDSLRQQVDGLRAELAAAQDTAASRQEVIQQLMQRTETSSSQGHATAAELTRLQASGQRVLLCSAAGRVCLTHCNTLSVNLETNAKVIEKLVELNSELMDNLNGGHGHPPGAAGAGGAGGGGGPGAGRRGFGLGLGTVLSASPPSDPSITFKKRFWTFIDVVAILGSVGGALAAILNLFSGTYVLFLPLVLPVVSLLSALQREGLIAEDNRRAYDTLRASLARDSSGLLGEARSAIDDVRRELKGQSTTAARLATIEARLSSLEGSILSVGRAAREAAAGLGMLPERLGGEQRVVLEGLVGAMRVELRRAAESLANNETTALARLDARLAAVEGSLSGLEVAQSEGMRRLGMSLNSALADAEATLQSSVRNEVARSMEPAIVGQELDAAVGRILDLQAEGFGRLGAVRPTPMDDEQWGALGRRLSRLERLVEGVPAAAEGSLAGIESMRAALAALAGQGLTPNEVISEGLRLLRLGREETRKGEDYGLADTLLQSAVAAFTSASELAPANAKALGNLGNALLARGELKAAYLEALRAGPPPATYAEAEAQRGAETAMTGEANALLTQAGLMFMKVLEMEGWSSRALVNWGRALLYTSAINKFEGVLEGEPDMIPAKYSPELESPHPTPVLVKLPEAGRKEEKTCRFCQDTLPDWKQVLTPAALPPAIPVLSIYYNNTCCRMKVRPGPDGLQAFLRQLEVIVGRDVAQVNFVFRCRCPDTGAEIFLQEARRMAGATSVARQSQSAPVPQSSRRLGSVLGHLNAAMQAAQPASAANAVPAVASFMVSDGLLPGNPELAELIPIATGCKERSGIWS